MQLIPAIDLRGGHVVRLLKGEFDQETQYDFSPAALYERYEKMGARHLHIVDLDGARDGARVNRAVIETLARKGTLRVQVGGGIRSESVLAELLDSGVSRAVVGSVAVTQPDEVVKWLARFGAEAIVLALDVRLSDDGVPLLATHGWREQSSLSLWDCVARYAHASLRHVLCTDVGRDGALTGPNTELYTEAVARFPNIEWQASGGVRDAADLAELARIGVAGAISGKALLESRMTPEEMKPFLPGA